MHEGGCVKEFFFVILQVGIPQPHYRLTSSQIIFRDFKYMNAFEYLATSSSSINAHERHRKATSSSRMNA